MEPEHRRWSIAVHAKAKGFDFRLRATRILHRSRISVLLRIPRFCVRMKSGTGLEVRRGARKSRFSRFWGRVFRRKSESGEKKGLVRREGPEVGKSPGNGFPEGKARQLDLQDPVSAAIGSLSLLCHSASKSEFEAITIHGFTFLFYLIILLKRKKSHFSWFFFSIILSLVGSSLIYTIQMSVAMATAWKTWTNIISIGCLFSLFQIFLSRTMPLIGISWIRWVMGLALTLVALQCKTTTFLLPRGLEDWLQGASVWIPNLLLTCQAFTHILGQSRDPQAVGVYASSVYLWVKEINQILVRYMGS